MSERMRHTLEILQEVHKRTYGEYCGVCKDNYGDPLKFPCPTRSSVDEGLCTCELLPEEEWWNHYGTSEPGSMYEPNPECPVHFP